MAMISVYLSVAAMVASAGVLVSTLWMQHKAKTADAALLEAVKRRSEAYRALDSAISDVTGRVNAPWLEARSQTAKRDRIEKQLSAWLAGLNFHGQTPVVLRSECVADAWLDFVESPSKLSRRRMESTSVAQESKPTRTDRPRRLQRALLGQPPRSAADLCTYA